MKEAIDLLNRPMVEWDAEVSRLTSAQRQEREADLSALCQKAARLIGYLEQRGTTGCGDSGHAEAVKNSNRLATSVRKALGYTYESKVTF